MAPVRISPGHSCRALAAAALLVAQPAVWAKNADGVVVQAPHYGEVLFQFYKQDYFTALTHLYAYRETGRVEAHADEAELLQGGLMLSWGQHDEASEIFERLLANSVNPSVRNRTWFYLGKVRYQRGYLEAAEQAFESVDGQLPPDMEAERYNLLASIYMDQQRFADAAALLGQWQGDSVWAAYARFNLGVALVRLGEIDAGAGLLDQVGRIPLGETASQEEREELLGLRDRANLALGFAYLQADFDGPAKPVLQRVRLNGPFSNKALLGVGWADAAANDYRRALVPWLELNDRERLDSAVQESLLAVPYAYSQLDARGLAAQYYARALDIFGTEINRLDSAIAGARDGRLLSALLAEDDVTRGGWYWQLDTLPADDRARYLSFTIADHGFHEGLKSYRDLVSLNSHLDEWREKLSAFSDMLDTRIVAYGERMPVLQARIDSFDIDSMQEGYEMLAAHSVAATQDRDIVTFANAEQQRQWDRLVAMQESPAWSAASDAQRQKHRLLKGLLAWELDKDFKLRAWQQSRNMDALAQELAASREQFDAIEAATASIPGTVRDFDSRIALLKPRIDMLQGRLQASMDDYADYLQRLAEAELAGQRERLLTYQAQARYALASLYDQMSAEKGRQPE